MTPIYKSLYQAFTARELRPRGWLKRQLRIQAEGLSGHLDKMWPDVQDAAWIGGSRDGWERVPYWLDGFIPLAFLLDDDDLKARAKKYVDGILARQQPDGWLCPCRQEERRQYDLWALFIICKALMVYADCSGDERIEGAIYRAMKNLLQHLRGCTLFGWGQSRWFEALLPLKWLQEKRPEPWMEELAVLLASQGLDYQRMFACWRNQQPDAQGIWAYHTHIVNLMMALKSEAVFSGISGQDSNAFAKRMYALLMQYHGTPIGHIQGDECLAGRSPIRGTELCAIAEAMYSCEVLSQITGDMSWADLLEQLAFNSLPATISADMWTHQYDQQLNQLSCIQQQEPPVFGTNGTQANLFGLEPNFGCCTANFNQAWPKLALSTFLKTDAGVLSSVLVPAQVETEIGGVAVRIALDTDYPFKGALRYTVSCPSPVQFELAIRVPGFVAAATVDGQAAAPGAVVRLGKVWQGEETVEVRLEMTPQLVAHDDMACLRRGPLFFALPIPAQTFTREYERNGVARKFPYCDYTIFPDGNWEYGFAGGDFRVIEHEIGDYPFSREQPPVQIAAQMARIHWGTIPGQPGVCNPAPLARESLGTEEKLLQPYGCTTLRMTVMPEAR